ncbi:hypothetical protein HDV00_003405 [Rhizophlyctis rosea]|nr:hypothetical protein HDV00_003405 [Rhizophlyctis rosea]
MTLPAPSVAILVDCSTVVSDCFPIPYWRKPNNINLRADIPSWSHLPNQFSRNECILRTYPFAIPWFGDPLSLPTAVGDDGITAAIVLFRFEETRPAGIFGEESGLQLLSAIDRALNAGNVHRAYVIAVYDSDWSSPDAKREVQAHLESHDFHHFDVSAGRIDEVRQKLIDIVKSSSSQRHHLQPARGVQRQTTAPTSTLPSTILAIPTTIRYLLPILIVLYLFILLHVTNLKTELSSAQGAVRQTEKQLDETSAQYELKVHEMDDLIKQLQRASTKLNTCGEQLKLVTANLTTCEDQRLAASANFSTCESQRLATSGNLTTCEGQRLAATETARKAGVEVEKLKKKARNCESRPPQNINPERHHSNGTCPAEEVEDQDVGFMKSESHPKWFGFWGFPK